MTIPSESKHVAQSAQGQQTTYQMIVVFDWT